MPTVSDSPRSAGGASRGGTLSSAPRSASSSGSRTTPAATSALGVRDPSPALQGKRSRPGALPGPLNAVLRAANVTNLAIGDAIQHPEHIIRGGPSFADLYSGRKGESIGNALEQRGALDWVPEKYGLRSVAKLVADIGLDPTTYITFGGGGAVKSASIAGSEHLLASMAARAGRASIADVAKAGAVREAALAAAPRRLSVGFRVPLTRGKVVTLAESRTAAAAGEKVASAIGNTRGGEVLREVFLPAGSASKAAHRIGSDARRYGEAEKRLVTRDAVGFQRRVEKAASKEGMSTDDAYRSLVRSIEQPDKYTVPDALVPLRDEAAGYLDQFRVLEDTAGIDRGTLEDIGYVPHLAADSKTRRTLARMFPVPAGRRQFFQHSRVDELHTLDDWEALGLKPEYNLARLIEVRGHASVDARVLKAFDDAVADVPGVTTPDVLRVKEMIRPAMASNANVEEAKNFVNAVGSSWKALALLSPGYHARNMQSDLISAWWAGARNPASFVQAARLLRGKGSITIAGRKYTAEEFTNLAEAAGAIRIGQAGKEIRAEKAAAGGVKRTRRGPSRPGHGRAASASSAVSSAREDMTRLGTFIERMKAGDDAMSAAKVTRDFLFDYGDVGKFVDAARRFWLPFITFPSKAVPMVGRQIVKRPGTLATLAKVEGALNEAGGAPDLSLLSQGSRSSFAVPAPSWLRTAIGAPEGQPLLFNPESVTAYGTLNQLDPTNPLRSVGGFLNPIPKAAIEGKTGYSFYFDGPGGKTVRAPAFVNALNRVGVPIPGYRQKTDQYSGKTYGAFSRNLDLVLRILPLYGQSAPLIPGGGSDTTRLPYLKYFAGLSISPYDRARAAFYAEKYGR